MQVFPFNGWLLFFFLFDFMFKKFSCLSVALDLFLKWVDHYTLQPQNRKFEKMSISFHPIIICVCTH